MNNVIISGNLTSEPEVRFIGETSLAEFTVAVNDRYKQGDEWKERTSFIRCRAWRWLADKIGDSAHKGDGCVVVGNLEQDKWEEKESGKTRERTLVNVREFELTRRAPQPKREDKAATPAPPVDPVSDDDIPY